MQLLPAGERSFVLEPWPFQATTVRVRCEGRRLSGRFADEADMRRGLAEAPLARVELVLSRSA